MKKCANKTASSVGELGVVIDAMAKQVGNLSAIAQNTVTLNSGTIDCEVVELEHLAIQALRVCQALKMPKYPKHGNHSPLNTEYPSGVEIHDIPRLEGDTVVVTRAVIERLSQLKHREPEDSIEENGSRLLDYEKEPVNHWSQPLRTSQADLVRSIADSGGSYFSKGVLEAIRYRSLAYIPLCVEEIQECLASPPRTADDVDSKLASAINDLASTTDELCDLRNRLFTILKEGLAESVRDRINELAGSQNLLGRQAGISRLDECKDQKVDGHDESSRHPNRSHLSLVLGGHEETTYER